MTEFQNEPIIVEHKKFPVKMYSHPHIGSNYIQEDLAHKLKLTLKNLRYQAAEIAGIECVIVADAALTFRPVDTPVKFPIRTTVKVVRNIPEQILVNKEISGRFSTSDLTSHHSPRKIFDPPQQSHLSPDPPPNPTTRPTTCPASDDYRGPPNIVCFSSVGPGVCEGVHEDEYYFAPRSPPPIQGRSDCPSSEGYTGPPNIVCFSSAGPGVCEGIHEDEYFFAPAPDTDDDDYEVHRPHRHPTHHLHSRHAAGSRGSGERLRHQPLPWGGGPRRGSGTPVQSCAASVSCFDSG